MSILVAGVPKKYQLSVRYRLMSASGTLEPEMRYLNQLVPSGRLALDIGANWGVYTLALSRLGVPVAAFEPQPWCAEGIRRAGLPNTQVYETGLSDIDGELSLHVPTNKGVRQTGYASFEVSADHEESVLVPVRRLDDLNLGDVGFIKIDVEGHESAVIRGGADTIRRCRPNMLVEIDSTHLGVRTMESVFADIEALDYDGFFLLDGAWKPLAQFSTEEHQRAFLSGAEAPYIYNFVFLPKGSEVQLVALR